MFDTLAEKVKASFKISISDEQIRTAIQTPLTEAVLMWMYSVQGESCVRCGNCCRIPRSIAFEKESFRKIAKSLKLSYKKLKKRVRARTEKGIVRIPGAPCPFLKGKNHCTIYDLRPFVCQVYPMGKTISTVLSSNRAFLIADCPAFIKLIMLTITARITIKLMQEKGIEIPSWLSPEELAYLDSTDRETRMRFIQRRIERGKRRSQNI